MPIHKYIIENFLYPAMERYKGNQIRTILSALQQSQYGDVSEIQRKQLTQLLLHCKNHVPAYQTITASEEQIAADPFDVFYNQVPILPKRSFQRNAEAYLADNVAQEKRIANCTGGSTGEPVHFYMTRQQVESYEAARWRGLSWYGISQGSRSVMLWGSPIELSKQEQIANKIREHILKNRCILSAYALSHHNLKRYIRFLQRYKPEYLYGYATILTAFAQMIEAQGIEPNISLKAVVSTSETLEDWQQKLLQRVFHCPIANEYGARDAGILAYSCPNGSMHISAENCILEVLDPITYQPLPSGESGLLAITDLRNYVQPRLRYILGDIGTLGATPCACGRTLPLLLKIDGREDDLLIGHGGALVHGNIIGQLLRPMEGLSAFQFRQHTPTQATLYLVKKSPDIILNESEIRSKMWKVLPDTKINIQYVSTIPPTASGKMRYAVRECSIAQRAVK